MDVFADTYLFDHLRQIESPDVAVIFDQEKVIELVHIVVRKVLQDVERFKDFPGVREPDNPSQINPWWVDAVVKEHNFINQVGRCLIDGDAPGVDGAGAGHHADKQLLPKSQLGGVVSGPIQVLRHPLRLLRLSGQINSRLEVLCIAKLATSQRPTLREVSIGASDLFSLRRTRFLEDGRQE